MHNAHCWDQVGANTRYHRQMEKGRGCDEKPMPFPKRLKVSTVAKHDAGRDCEYDEVESTDKYNVKSPDAIDRPCRDGQESKEDYDDACSQVICQMRPATEGQAFPQVKPKSNHAYPTTASRPIEEFDSERSDHKDTD